LSGENYFRRKLFFDFISAKIILVKYTEKISCKISDNSWEYLSYFSRRNTGKLPEFHRTFYLEISRKLPKILPGICQKIARIPPDFYLEFTGGLPDFLPGISQKVSRNSAGEMP